jgi:hypothetical protein
MVRFSLICQSIWLLTKGNARPGTKCFNEPNKEVRGIWFKARGAEKFIKAFDFKELAIDLIPKVVSKTDEIARADTKEKRRGKRRGKLLN